MTDTPTALKDRLDRLKDALDAQGAAVVALVEDAVEALFEGDEADARRVIDADAPIDREDVRIEREAVALLQEAVAGERGLLSEAQIRLVLTIVKVNNEVERIADLMVLSAGQAAAFRVLREGDGPGIPPAFRVLANSVIGIVQLTVQSLRRMDGADAGVVLRSEDTTEAFKRALLRDTESRLARGEGTVDEAFALHSAAAAFARAADHCTNISEQIIYVDTGLIVRHENDKWSDPTAPELNDA